MEDKEYITREEFEKFRRDVDNKIDGVKDSVNQIEKSTLKIEYSVSSFNDKWNIFKKDMDSMNQSINNLKEKPSKEYDKYKITVITCILTGITMYILSLVLK